MKLNKFLRLYFQTTNMCTNKCDFCCLKDSGPLPDRFPKTITPADFDDCILKIKNYLDKNKHILKIFCPYNSNEPFADRTLMLKLDLFYEYFPYTRMEIATNGTLLTSKISERFLEILTKNMSDEKHDIYFNIPGIDNKTFKRNSDMSFRRTILNFINFAEMNGNRINIHLKTEWDKECGYEKKDIFNFWDNLNISKNIKEQISFEMMYPSDRAGNLKGVYDLKIQMEVLSGCNFRNLLDNIYVIQNGDVVTCCNDWYNTMTVGNLLREKTFEDIVNSEKYWQLFKWIYGIEKAPPDFICRKCYNSIGLGSRPIEFKGGEKYCRSKH